MFYTLGVASFYYLGIYHIKDTNYDHHEEGAVIPNHILEGTGLTEGQHREEIIRGNSVTREEKGAGVSGEKVRVDGDSA